MFLIITAERQVFSAQEVSEEMKVKADEGLLIIVNLADESFSVDGELCRVTQYED